jgi:hypothetical protein
MPSNDSQLYFIGKASGSSNALDYWTAEEAVFPRGTTCFSLGRNNHPLVVFPEDEVGFVDFQGVLPPSGIVKVLLYWTATVTAGNVLWDVAFERDNPTFFLAQTDLDVDSFAPVKMVLSQAPAVSGLIREAFITFTPAETGGVQPGEPYRIRVRRSAGVFPDTLLGDAQLFRVVLGAAP